MPFRKMSKVQQAMRVQSHRKRRIQVFLRTLFLLTTSAVPADGKTYYIRCATNKNFCVTVNGSSVANGANMIISKLTNSLKQKFMCRKLSDGTLVFTNLHSGKAIRIEGNNAKNYANLWQYEFSGARSGRWKPIKNSDGSYRIASMLNSNIVFDVYAGSIAENSNLQVYKSNNTAAQKFIFTEAPIPNYAGDIQMRPTNALTKCVAPAKNSKASGADIQLTNANNKDNLKYTAVHYVAGYYILVNKSNGMALTVENNGSKSGCNVVQEKRTNKFSQQWLIRRYSDGTFAYLPRANSSISMSKIRTAFSTSAQPERRTEQISISTTGMRPLHRNSSWNLLHTVILQIPGIKSQPQHPASAFRSPVAQPMSMQISSWERTREQKRSFGIL